MFRQRTLEKLEKKYPSSACPRKIEKSHPWGQKVTSNLASLVTGYNSDPSDQISLSYIDIHGGLLLGHWLDMVYLPWGEFCGPYFS